MVEMTRSCLKEMQLPSQLWGEAVRNSVYLLNSLPTRALTGRTPYEVWRGKKPDIGHVRVFGCIAHMKLPGIHVRKLDDRSKVVVNLRREPGTKGYRLYDPEGGRIYISRDMIFEETKTLHWGNTAMNRTQPIEFTPLKVVTNEEEVEIEDMNDGLDPPSPPQSQSSNLSHDNYDDSVEPKKFKGIADVYNETEEIELNEELLLMGVEEPVNYKQAAKNSEWKEAMKQEIKSIEENKTWELPPGEKIIGLKWIYKLKKDASGKIVKHKARLVAKGYVQEHGVDFDEVYAPVTRLETVRLLLALSAKNNWQVHHLDVKTAFLNGDIQENVYVAQPKGFKIAGQEHLVYKLSKALYGLRQAPRAWYAKLNSCLLSLGFSRCPYEHAVYTRKERGESLIVAVYVDDILVTGTSIEVI